MIGQANTIIADYQAQGYRLTLRQLYYQFVARDLIPNTMRSYKRLGSIINDGRLAGLIDWTAIEDRTRHVEAPSHWDSPSNIIDSCAYSYRIDKWADQEYRPEVWIEKEALAGVIERVCTKLDIAYLSCRGYTSQSEMWSSGGRLGRMATKGQTPVILHFGDHDPSGLDMTRDIVDRMRMFMGGVRLERLALNMDQVQTYDPPPNPAKVTDSRYEAYVAEFGDESWELDALEPAVLAELVENAVLGLRDDDKWAAKVEREADERRQLDAVAGNWQAVADMVDGLDDD